MANRAAIGLGSNLGDRDGHLQRGIEALGHLGSVVRVSSSYETSPIGGPEQGAYLNAVVVLDTNLDPRSLLEELLDVEKQEGRERRVRWGPRTLDLDLLLYGDLSVDEEGLTVPHPELTARRFALVPLLEAWPKAMLPDGTRLDTFLAAVADQSVTSVGKATLTPEDLPSWAPVALFLIVGVGAVAIWWLMGLFL